MLVIPNGYLSYSDAATAADLDENGLPIAASATTNIEVRCYIATASENRNAVYDGGTYKRASYTVLCNMDEVGEGFKPRTIRLRHDQKGTLGELQVMRIEYYVLTQTIELWV